MLRTIPGLESLRRLGPGLFLVLGISAAGFALASIPTMAKFGLSALTIAIVIGAVVGNVAHSLHSNAAIQPGLGFAQKSLLRTGVALYGLNLSWQQIRHVGPAAILVDFFVVGSTILTGWWVGYRWLKMDRDTVLLASAGSGICGAAAVVATESVLGAAPHKTSAAVGQVVLFGSLAMLVYPLLFGVLGATQAPFGIYVGSTVHEVAQVVAIGKTIGGAAAETAVIVKMIRVMMLAPFLMLLGRFVPGSPSPARSLTTTRVPGFAVSFIVIALVHSYLPLPPRLIDALRLLDVVLLAAAMAALGLDTTIAKLRLAGRESLVLGAVLFAYLVVVGGAANWIIQHAF